MDVVYGFIGAIVLLTIAFLILITGKDRKNDFTSQ